MSVIRWITEGRYPLQGWKYELQHKKNMTPQYGFDVSSYGLRFTIWRTSRWKTKLNSIDDLGFSDMLMKSAAI